MAKKKSKLPPAKVIITMGVKITQTQFIGTVSAVDVLNATIALMRDTQKFSGMQYKEIFAIVDEGVGGEVFRKKPTMNASKSNETAELDDSEELS